MSSRLLQGKYDVAILSQTTLRELRNHALAKSDLITTILFVRYKPWVPGKPCTSRKNVGFLDRNAQLIHTAQKIKLYCQGRTSRKAPAFYCGF